MLNQDHYIYRLRAACILQPELNRHQLAALDREIGLVRAAATPEAHLEASGHLIGIARATALDRAVNALDIARRHDDPWTAAAAGIEFVQARQGSNHVELYTNIQRAHERSAPLRAQANEINGAFTRLFLNLLHIHTSNFELHNAYAEVASSFQIIRNSDPAFRPYTWLDQPRYRRRLPWPTDLLHDWLAPCWDDCANPPELPADPGFIFAEPTIAVEDWPDAQPLEAAPDLTIAGMYLQRQSEWPDEFLAAFWQDARKEMLAARSPIAQEAIATEWAARFSAESTANLLALTALLAPFRAIAIHGWEQTEESLAGIEKANATIQALTGHAPDEIAALPRVQHFLTNNLYPRLEHGTSGFGAFAGEAGFDFVKHAALWQECEQAS